MSQLTRDIFISSITDKLAVGIPTPHSLLSRTIFKAMNPGAGASFAEQLRMLTAGNKIDAKRLLAAHPEMKSTIKKMVKEANRPYPGIATQTMQDAMFPHFIRQRMQEASLLPETAQVKIRNGLKNLARDRGYSGIFEAQLADSPEYLLNLKQIGR